ncbi:MAG: hypothetical protein E3J86_11330 [Candidatus Thorarchaeota archaeon]|nr:MAG: hypothetical protein E3J86_11330 [Candidatus Thorarchaeota archaeon]
MYQRTTENEHQTHDSGENLGTQFVSEAKNMTGLILEDAGSQMDRNLLFKQHENMKIVLDRIWSDVEEGKIEVGCLPLLRTARSVSCPEISRKLKAPEIDHAKIIRDLKLMVNTFRYVIKPKNSRNL